MILLLIIIPALAFAGFLVKTIIQNKNWEYSPLVMFSFFLGAIITIPTLIISAKSFPIEVSRHDIKIPIYSLRNSDQIQGSFFLGSGQINQTEYYYTFIDNGRGGFNRFKIPSYNVTIYQDEKGRPYLSYQMVTYRHSKWVSLFNFTWEEKTRYDFHVPENTIIQEYELN